MTQRTYPAGMTPTAVSLGSTAQASIRLTANATKLLETM
jgi:hypothetical protein